MRLYSRADGTSVVCHAGVSYKPGPSGGFDFPDAVSDVLHPVAVRGQRQWETDIERQHRLVAEEMERRRDPASLYDAVAKIMQAAESATGRSEPAKARTAAGK